MSPVHAPRLAEAIERLLDGFTIYRQLPQPYTWDYDKLILNPYKEVNYLALLAGVDAEALEGIDLKNVHLEVWNWHAPPKPDLNRDAGKEPGRDKWKAALLALRDRAEAAAEAQSDEGQGRGSAAEAGMPAGATRGKNINGRMLEMLQEDASRVGWPARKWADQLDCSVSTVQGTTAWKNILNTRKLEAVEAVNRRGDGRRSDRRRLGKSKRSDEK
jgi:hypothetical protein